MMQTKRWVRSMAGRPSRLVLIGALIPPALLLAGTGCQLDRNEAMLMAGGAYGDLAVVVSQDNLEPAVQPFLARLNQRVSFVIKEEMSYKVDVYRPDKWKLCKNFKNILFVVQWGAGGPVQKEVSHLLSDESLRQARGGHLVQLNNPYARYQYVLVAVSPDRNMLASLLNRNVDEIRSGLEASSRDRIMQRFRHEGIAEDLVARNWNKYHFHLEIPRAYRQNQENPRGFPCIEWMRNAPSRGITLAWREEADPRTFLGDHDQLLAWRREMGEKVHDEELVAQSLAWSDTTVAGMPAVKLTGAWSGLEFAGGGPFWSLFVPDAQNGRVFCIDLLCYAPSEDKLPFFREMQAIASTFSVEAPQP
jgi:hypothetical protein